MASRAHSRSHALPSVGEMGTARDALRGALLQSTSSTGSKEPDGVLTPTPDAPGDWRSRSGCLDCVPTTSTYLEDDDDGACRAAGQPGVPSGRPQR
jgi:hypothetical protein